MQRVNNRGSQKAAISKGSRRSPLAIASFSLALALALSACSANNIVGAGEAAAQDAVADGGLVIQISDISETPKFYPATVDGTRLEVFAVKAGGGTIRTAFNTCQVCNGSPKAYFLQSGASVQCQNCGNKFSIGKIGLEAGGCNPVPILDDEKTVTDESITIPYDTLQANAYRFPDNWKQ